ncbi:PREDICTED: uncharacterized protein LOC104600511 [Nelumbo nucifera]|uniref:Protein LAZY 1-like n=2 Tax=Nelumbo nucifera TaxID=4432 RepID=A0A822ZHW2_NELNU|nr:PREDICTED: uncharacterized protein LOC104600511 [Nelumbo nucifera]DAD44213.1 TPA_asm: hypothetical protein HUJ06_002443 [Nelumbo nucifera]
MKIFSWMQSKIHGRPGNKKPSGVLPNHLNLREPLKEEFSDWPHGLLAIGTFGNNDLKGESERCDPLENPSSSQDLLDFTAEEVGKLEKELTKLLSHKPDSIGTESTNLGETIHLPLDKFLNCPSSLDVDRTNCHKFCEDSEDKNDNNLLGNTSIVLSKGKDVCVDGKKAIGKRSITFLLKKIFVCRSGFPPAPAPSLWDQLPESRMEKLLRAILHKKIYPQSSTSSSLKKYLDNRQMLKAINKDDELEETSDDGCKWDKTDSEYIVLEI